MRALHDGHLIDDYTLSRKYRAVRLEDANRHLYAEGWAGTRQDYFNRLADGVVGKVWLHRV